MQLRTETSRQLNMSSS